VSLLLESIDDNKPFSWTGAGKKLFAQEEGEEVPLPDLIEVKTGNRGQNK
jgi:hypothetical protein